MYVKNGNTATRRLGGDAIRERNDGDAVEFNENGSARVTAELGEYLAEEYDPIEITDRERGGQDDEDD